MSGRGLRIELVTTQHRLAELEPELWALFADSTRATPFQSPSWLLTWAECFVAAGNLRVLMVFSGPRLVASVPLFLENGGERPAFRLLGCGISDYLDALGPADESSPVLPLVVGVMRDLVGEAGEVDLTDLPASSWLRRLGELCPGARLEVQAVCPYVDLPGDFPEYLGSLPAWLLRNLRKSELRLSRRGTLGWELADAVSLDRHLDSLFALHTAQWQARGSAGVLASAELQRFHRRVAPELLRRGMLQLSTLSLAEQPIAVAYAFSRRDAHFYLTGFDPSIGQVSLGSLVIARSIAQAMAMGQRRVDFLRGTEPYKYAWGATNAFTYRVVLRTGST